MPLRTPRDATSRRRGSKQAEPRGEPPGEIAAASPREARPRGLSVDPAEDTDGMIRDLPRSQERTPPRHATECHMNKPRRKSASGGWRLQDDRPPTFRGWTSTDEGEIRRREWRGRTEIVDVHALDGSPHPFGDYRVTSSSGSSYTVEIRSLGTHINSCGCRDHRTNRLGTCKHIAGCPAPPARQSCRPAETPETERAGIERAHRDFSRRT